MPTKPLRIAVCEDQPEDRVRLLRLIHEEGDGTEIDVFDCAEDLLLSYVPGRYHLLFLDIYMGAVSGIEAAQSIRQQDSRVLIAFCTTSPDFALEASRQRALLYMEKPVSVEGVRHVLGITQALLLKQEAQRLEVPISGKQKRSIPFDDIRYIEAENQHCQIHLADGTTLLGATTTSMDELTHKLADPRFCRIHRSYLINFDYVDRLDEYDFFMRGGGKAYISQKQFKRIFQSYQEHLFRSIRKDVLP